MKKDIYNNLLISEFPSIKEMLNNECQFLDMDTPAINFYQCTFVPYIMKQIEANNEDELTSCFSFVEDMIDSEDELAVDIALNGILLPLNEKRVDLTTLPLNKNTLEYYQNWIKDSK